MKKIFKLCLCLITATFIISIFNACKPEPEPEPNTPGSVKVTTSSVSNITETSAKCGGTVTASGYSVGACGLCYSELPNPTVSSYITSDQVGTGTFTSTMSSLEPGTKYYVRAYATTSSGTLYGEQKEFTTKGNNSGGDDNDDDNGGGNGDDDNDDDNGGGNGDDDDEPTTGTINGHEWVDLGLPSGLKWATCNVGANSPEDYGNYYAWGETTTKSTYTEDNSLTYGLNESQLQSQGYIDGSGNLTPSHDAATANWGGSWRMPTKTEMQELIDNCTRTWTTQNGVKGTKMTGPNGNSIFLPASGGRYGSSLNFVGSLGYYWSSTPLDGNDFSAYDLFFKDFSAFVNWGYYRSNGFTVRPITE